MRSKDGKPDVVAIEEADVRPVATLTPRLRAALIPRFACPGCSTYVMRSGVGGCPTSGDRSALVGGTVVDEDQLPIGELSLPYDAGDCLIEKAVAVEEDEHA